MRNVLIASSLMITIGATQAEMMRDDALGNDPTKAKLCLSRMNNPKAKSVPFEIDISYVSRARSYHPDVTFIAIDGISPQLIECYLRDGDGKYGPASSSPEQNYWHILKPKQFEPSVNSPAGTSIAAKVCADAAQEKINRPDFDHSIYSAVVEIALGSPLYYPGASISGGKASRYDVAVKGKAFYKSVGPDLDVVNFSCLLSPMFVVKGIRLM